MNLQFQSKRNLVIYCDKAQCVVKTFTDPKDYFHELKVYQELFMKQWSKVPRIRRSDNSGKALYLDFIKGELILDVLMALELNGNHESNYVKTVNYLIQLVQWVKEFHQLFREDSYILGDVNYRNFILDKDQLIGFDFELVCVGNQDQEILELLSRYLIYSPIRSPFKVEVMKRVVHELYKEKAEECLEKIHYLADQRLEYRKKNKKNKDQ